MKKTTERIICLEGISGVKSTPEMPRGHLKNLRCLEGTIGCRKKITVCILCLEGIAAVKITPEIPRGH